jgi:hypothetical protein
LGHEHSFKRQAKRLLSESSAVQLLRLKNESCEKALKPVHFRHNAVKPSDGDYVKRTPWAASRQRDFPTSCHQRGHSVRYG